MLKDDVVHVCQYTWQVVWCGVVHTSAALHLVLETGTLMEPGAYQFGRVGQPASLLHTRSRIKIALSYLGSGGARL